MEGKLRGTTEWAQRNGAAPASISLTQHSSFSYRRARGRAHGASPAPRSSAAATLRSALEAGSRCNAEGPPPPPPPPPSTLAAAAVTAAAPPAAASAVAASPPPEADPPCRPIDGDDISSLANCAAAARCSPAARAAKASSACRAAGRLRQQCVSAETTGPIAAGSEPAKATSRIYGKEGKRGGGGGERREKRGVCGCVRVCVRECVLSSCQLLFL